MSAPRVRIHLVRHAQAEHNVAEDYSIPDAPLTALGRQQATELNERTKDNIQQSAELLVSSPLRRTLQTTLIGFPVLEKRLRQASPDGESGTKAIVPLSRLQEVNNLPCDRGSDRSVLEGIDEFKGIDFSSLEPDWNGKQGDFNPRNVAARAKWVRRWLRTRPEREIVVVAHGDILRQITHTPPEKAWKNAEVRLYTFAGGEDDEEAELTAITKETATGGKEPTSSDLVN